MPTTTTLRIVQSEERVGAGAAWSLSGNITVYDGLTRDAVFTIDGDSNQELRGFNAGFGLEATPIPDNTVIVGIEVVFARHYTEETTSGDARDQVVRLVKDDGAGGRVLIGQARNMAGAWKLGAPPQTDIVGSPTDDWGARLTGADVKSANFGASLKALGDSTRSIWAGSRLRPMSTGWRCG